MFHFLPRDFPCRAINGLYATSNVELLKRQGDIDFYRLLRILRKLQLTEAFSLRVEKKDEAETGVMVFRRYQVDQTTEAKAKEARKLLGLNPETQEFKLVFGATPENDRHGDPFHARDSRGGVRGSGGSCHRRAGRPGDENI
jgi:hypothetical protein